MSAEMLRSSLITFRSHFNSRVHSQRRCELLEVSCEEDESLVEKWVARSDTTAFAFESICRPPPSLCFELELHQSHVPIPFPLWALFHVRASRTVLSINLIIALPTTSSHLIDQHQGVFSRQSKDHTRRCHLCSEGRERFLDRV
jgi:hypothetical protein